MEPRTGPLVSSMTFSSFSDLRIGSNNQIYNDSAFGNKNFVASRIADRDTGFKK